MMYEKFSGKIGKTVATGLSTVALAGFAGEAQAKSPSTIRSATGIARVEASKSDPAAFERTAELIKQSLKNPQIVNAIIDIPWPKPMPTSYNDPRWKAFASHFYLTPYEGYVGQNMPDGPYQDSVSIAYPQLFKIDGEDWIKFGDPRNAIDRKSMNIDASVPEFSRWMKVNDMPPDTKLYRQLGYDGVLRKGPHVMPGSFVEDMYHVKRLRTEILDEGYVAMCSFEPAGYLEQDYTERINQTLEKYIHGK